MEYLLHKTGHCRLTLPFVQKAADKTPAEKICYSGTHTHTHTHSHVISLRVFCVNVNALLFFYFTGVFVAAPKIKNVLFWLSSCTSNYKKVCEIFSK